MLILLSPAKRLLATSKATQLPIPADVELTAPRLAQRSRVLMRALREYDERQLRNLFGISDALAQLNVDRNQHWRSPKPEQIGRNRVSPAIFTFAGDTYQGLQADRLSMDDLHRSETRLRILSGLHGLLRPFDVISPYRLEMGCALKVGEAKDLYSFWGNAVTRLVAGDVKACHGEAVVNLASVEYFSAVEPAKLPVPVVTPRFFDKTKVGWRIVSFSAKRARGAMANWLLANDIREVGRLKEFRQRGYRYAEGESTPLKPVFYADTPRP